MSWWSLNKAPATVKLAIASVLSTALALGAGCRSGEGAGRVNSATNLSGPSRTAGKVRPLTDRTFPRTPERLGRGRYLVNGIGECFACHGPFDLNAPGWPPVRGKEGSGFAFSSWVAHDGRLLDPTIMPYEFYRFMSDEDLASIIVYLRSIPPVRNVLPPPRTSKDVVAPYAILLPDSPFAQASCANLTPILPVSAITMNPSS
jgi:hypothetical protein